MLSRCSVYRRLFTVIDPLQSLSIISLTLPNIVLCKVLNIDTSKERIDQQLLFEMKFILVGMIIITTVREDEEEVEM